MEIDTVKIIGIIAGTISASILLFDRKKMIFEGIGVFVSNLLITKLGRALENIIERTFAIIAFRILKGLRRDNSGTIYKIVTEGLEKIENDKKQEHEK